jgi:hypothetical protein
MFYFGLKSTRFLGILILMQLFASISFAQNYSTKLYDERLGLYQKAISEILKDDDGFLWLGTESGLVRFDGSNFNEFFPKESKFKYLGISKIKKLRNFIYLNYEKNGLLAFDLNSYQYKQLLDEAIIDMQPISDSTFVVITKAGFLKKINSGKIVQQIKVAVTEGSLLSLFRGDLYLSLPEIGINRYNTSHLKLLKSSNRIIPDGYRESFDSGDKNLVFVSKSEVKIVAGDLLKLANIKNALLGANPIDDISYYKYVSPNSQFYFIQNKNISQVLPTGIRNLYFKDIINYELLSLLSIDSNSFFVGTGQGLILVRKNDFPNSVIDDNIPLWGNALRVRRSIIEKKDGSLILMGYPQNIQYKNQRFNLIGDLVSSTNHSILLGDDIYTGNDILGFLKINSITGVSQVLAHSADKQSYFGVYHDTVNSLMVAGGNGFLAIHNLQTRQTKVLTIFKERISIRAIAYESNSNNYWLGTANGLYICDHNFNIIKHFASKFKNTNGDYYSALLIPNGGNEIWAAHNEGVSIFNLQTQKLIKNLPSNLFLKRKTVSLIEDDFHRIWMGTYQGIIGFDPKTKQYIRLTRKNNLVNSEFNYASATKLANGNLIFGGLNAYDIINPANFKFDTTSIQPIISGYAIYGKNDTTFYKKNSNQLSINIDNHFVKIFLATSNLISTNNTTLEYRIDDGPWLSTNELKQISLFNLNPGEHLLHIRAFDEYGAVSEMTPFLIYAYVSFYKSNLFLWTLIVLTLTGFALYIYANYRNKLMQKITKENIAMDLHDEVGTMLTRVLYLMKLESKESKVVSYLSDALFSLRVYINTMNKSKFGMEQLLDELIELSTNILGEDKVDIKVTDNQQQYFEINSDLFRDIKLCIYEVLNNIQKHAFANEVHLDFTIVENTIKIRIKDNGCYDKALQKSSNGHGFDNIKKRVARNQGIVKFEQNTEGTGLQVSLSIPLK